MGCGLGGDYGAGLARPGYEEWETGCREGHGVFIFGGWRGFCDGDSIDRILGL